MVLGALASTLKGRSSSAGSSNDAGIDGSKVPPNKRHLASFSSNSSEGQASLGSMPGPGRSRLWDRIRGGSRRESASQAGNGTTYGSDSPSLRNLTKGDKRSVTWAQLRQERSASPVPEGEQSGSYNPPGNIIIRRCSSSLDAVRENEQQMQFSLADLVSSGSNGIHSNGHGNDAVLLPPTYHTTTTATSSPALSPGLYPEGDALDPSDDVGDGASITSGELTGAPAKYAMHSVCYVVKDIKRSLHFYEDLLGMELVHTIDNEDHQMYFLGYPVHTSGHASHPRSRDSSAFYNSDAASVHSLPATVFGRRTGLIQLIGVPGSESDPTFSIKHADSQGYNHMTLSVPNVSRAMRRLRLLGAAIVDDGTANPGFGVIQDPDGYHIMLMSRDEGHDAWIRHQIRSAMSGRALSAHNINGLESNGSVTRLARLAGFPPQLDMASSSNAHSCDGSIVLAQTNVSTPDLDQQPAIATCTVTTTLYPAESDQDEEHLRQVARAQTARGGTPTSIKD